MIIVLRNETRSGTKWKAKRERFSFKRFGTETKRKRFFSKGLETGTKRQRFFKTSKGNRNAFEKSLRNKKRNGNTQNRFFPNPGFNTNRRRKTCACWRFGLFQVILFKRVDGVDFGLLFVWRLLDVVHAWLVSRQSVIHRSHVIWYVLQWFLNMKFSISSKTCS